MPAHKTVIGSVSDSIIAVIGAVIRSELVVRGGSRKGLAGIAARSEGDVYDRVAQASLAQLGMGLLKG